MMTYNLLENWSIHKMYNGSYVLMGEIYNDAKERFTDGTHVRTSPLRSINFSVGIADTQNTRYVLGRRGSDGEIH